MSRRCLIPVWIAMALGAGAQSLNQRMLSASVSISASALGVTRDAAGFLLDSRHVATNLTACCSRAESPQVTLGKANSRGKIIWSSKESGLAILELDQPLEGVAVTIAPSKLWHQGQAVYTVQFGASGSSIA